MPRIRTILAFVLAPILASAIISFATPLMIAGPGSWRWGEVYPLFVAMTTVALLVTLLVGPFCFAFMQHRNWRGWAHYLGAGMLAAVSGVLVLMALSSGGTALMSAAWSILWAVPVGTLTALLGWAIRRPDRDLP